MQDPLRTSIGMVEREIELDHRTLLEIDALKREEPSFKTSVDGSGSSALLLRKWTLGRTVGFSMTDFRIP